ADLGPTSGVDPDTSIFYCELCGGWIFDKFWHARRAWFPFCAAIVRDKFREASRDKRGCVRFAIPLDWRAQQLGHAMQNLHSAIFGVAAQTNDRRNIEIEFPKRLRQTVRRPVLFLARDTGAGTEITHQPRLGENN